MKFKKIADNRNLAIDNMNNGVGKLNSLMMGYRNACNREGADVVALKNQLVGQIVELVQGKVESPKKIDPNVFYASIEALSDLSMTDPDNTVKSVIIGLFDNLEKQKDGLTKKQQEEIFGSDKMTAIKFEAYVGLDMMQEASQLLPQLQNVSRSHGVVGFCDFFNKEVKSIVQNTSMSKEQVEKIKQDLVPKLAETIKFLTDKFEKTYDYATGVELLKLKMTTGTDMSQIKKLANAVYLSSKKFNVQEFASNEKLKDYSLVVQLSGDKEALANLAQITKASTESKTVGNRLFNKSALEHIEKSRAYKGMSQEEQAQFRNNYNELETIIDNFKVNEESKKKADSIISNSYSYAGTLGNIEEATYVGGNFQFKGQVPDHCITKNDVLVFDTLLNTKIYKLFPLIDVNGSKDDAKNRKIPDSVAPFVDKKLTDLDFSKDMSAFMIISDEMIRNRFTTMNFAGSGLNMEEQALLKESSYNDAFKSIMAESGAFGLNVNGNSLTNISTLFSEGLGDCRHHAQVKQIMFDRWKDTKMNQAIKDLSTETNEAEKATIRESIDNMSLTELRTFDVRISSNIEMEESVWFNSWNNKVETGDSMYRPARDENGKFVVKDKMACLEEHTMCMLVTRDQTGGLKNLQFADAFYQEPGKGGDYDLSYDRAGAKNLAESVQPVWNERANKYLFTIDQKDLFNKENIQNGEDVTVSFAPTNYAGKRDYELYGKFEHSQICGIEYDKEITAEQMLTDIAETDKNHIERKQAGETYSFVRKCIVKNLISKNIREDDTLDVEPEHREALELDCKTKKVTQMDESAEKRLREVCNGLSEMRSQKYCDILYMATEKLAEQAKNNPEVQISEDFIEQICDECSAQYFKENNLENAEANRENELKKRAKNIKLYCESDGNENKEQVFKNSIKYLSLSFPQEIIDKFKKDVELSSGEIDFDAFVNNVIKLEAGQEVLKEQIVEQQEVVSQSQNEVVTPEDIKENPLKITEVTTEQFAGDPVAYEVALKEGAEKAEQSGADNNLYSTLNKDLQHKEKTIERTIQLQQEQQQAQQPHAEKSNEEELQNSMKAE